MSAATGGPGARGRQRVEDVGRDGFGVAPSGISAEVLQRVRDSAFANGAAGTRCLLNLEPVGDAVSRIRQGLADEGLLTSGAVAIQAIAFDKTSEANWKVMWHQDVMFPFARAVEAEGFELPSRKDEVDYARPPLEVLERLLAVRLHLNDCGERNGPLRVSPGTHLLGILPAAEIPALVKRHGEVSCLAAEGEVLLMRPLLLHASSRAVAPRHRRVLHVVYYDGPAIPEAWHREV